MGWRSDKKKIVAEDEGLLAQAPAADFFAAMWKPKGLRRSVWRWLLCRRPPEPAPSHRGLVEHPEKGKLGISCSGGGIRSAAFCLGAMQELQERDVLGKASYLAAVSGGSYIAAAFSMVAKTSEEEPGDDSDPALFGRFKPFAHGSPEEQYLRNRASYLAPTLVDKLYLGWRVVLGLLVNLVFVSLPLVALALIFAGFMIVTLVPDLAGNCTHAHGVCAPNTKLDLPLGFVLAPIVPLGLSVVSGLGSILPRWRYEGVERFFSTWAVRLLILAATLALLFVALPYLIEVVLEAGHQESADSVATHRAREVGGATLALLTGVLVQLAHLVNSKETEEDVGRARQLLAKLGKGARLAVTYFAAAVVGPLLLFGIFVLAAAAVMPGATAGHVDGAAIAIGLALLAAFGLVYEYADLTTWSLNPFYKRRLSTAFALKRVRPDAGWREREGERFEARPSAAEDDVGIAVERDFDKLVPISETPLIGGEGKEWPTLLICAAANISDSAATPPGRAVTSFTFSAKAVGGPLVGAVEMKSMETVFDGIKRVRLFEPAPEKGGEGQVAAERTESRFAPQSAHKRRRRDLTLPAAMAMSGAAISPSMGKMTKRPLTFLMALANIRLGVWVPNPRWIDALKRDEHLLERNTRPRPLYLLWELLGINRIRAKYLYITDGGHYENLGLVELLRRGCTKIYCLDASGVGRDGAEFGALGEAIALARSELGVEIEFDPEDEQSDPSGLLPGEDGQYAERDVVTATIVFPAPPGEEKPVEGKLVYVRNTLTDKAPWDVRAHHETDPRFPNDPTIDQLYTDQKFEAYRVLGARAGVNAIALMDAS